jgi:hypothetical protein
MVQLLSFMSVCAGGRAFRSRSASAQDGELLRRSHIERTRTRTLRISTRSRFDGAETTDTVRRGAATARFGGPPDGAYCRSEMRADHALTAPLHTLARWRPLRQHNW